MKDFWYNLIKMAVMIFFMLNIPWFKDVALWQMIGMYFIISALWDFSAYIKYAPKKLSIPPSIPYHGPPTAPQ